ncbi:FtsX-like permease family protein [Halobellus rubicundus]|uniref:FtsX-like permease family protein n=1 Tax=Halobellus rubicundus TaxID=2996466 RepID=A0ABD5MHT0_9EURY
MRFESTLVASWSRREWLSVAVITVTAAFLVGSGVLLLTVGSYTSTLEDDLGSSASATYYGSYETAQTSADGDDIVFPLVRVSVDGDGAHRAVGIPPDAPERIESASVAWESAAIPRPPSEGLAGPVTQPTTQEVDGASMRVTPHSTDSRLFASTWYIGSAETVASLGDAGALVIDSGTAGQSGEQPTWRLDGVPLIAALPFLLRGVTQIIRTLSLAVVGSGVLILVVVYNVTRMSLRDRRQEIRVARATGISPLRLFGLLEGRVATVTGTGVLLGFAVGLIATNAVINAATYAGLPVTLRTVLTPEILRFVLLVSGFLFGMGLLAGALAAVPVIRRDPAALDGSGRIRGTGRSLPERLVSLARPTFVTWRALVPTTATLAVFVLIVLLISAIGGAVAPLATTSSGTVVESGAPHPLNSRLSEDYASVLRGQNFTASPEVLYAQTLDGDPYLIRGANFTSFSAVTGARLQTGHAPRATDQAVIGTSLASTLDLGVGETITVGGSVTPGVRRVRIVGTFAGDGITDDQLVVPLATAQELATGTGQVHLIRTNGTTQAFDDLAQDSGGIAVTGLSGQSSVAAGSDYTVTVTTQNLGDERDSRTVTVRLGNRSQTVEVTAAAGSTTRTDVTFESLEPGTYTVASDGVTKSLDVYSPRAFVIPQEYPDRAPPGVTLIVPAALRNGTTVPDATVTLGERRARTTDEGVAPIRVPTVEGEYTITVEKEGYATVTHTLVVEDGAAQELTGRLDVQPTTGTRLTDPTVEIQLGNPWGTFFVRNVSLVTPSTVETRTVEMAGGNVTRITVPAADAGFDRRIAPGSYDLRLVSDGTVLATATYRVSGDERVAATLASQGEYSSGTAIGRAIENVFGNVQVLFLVIVGLAGLSTVGGTTATFAYAVHTSRREIGIYRATGASPRRVLRLVFADAIRVAVPAAIVAFALAYAVLRGLVWADLLVVFGVRLSVPLSPFAVGATLLGAVALAAVSALGVALMIAYATPGRLLAAGR